MSWCLKTLTAVLVGSMVCAVQAQTQGQEDAFKPGKNLAPFSSEADGQAWFQPFVVKRQRRDEERRRQVNERRLKHEETRKKWESETRTKLGP